MLCCSKRILIDGAVIISTHKDREKVCSMPLLGSISVTILLVYTVCQLFYVHFSAYNGRAPGGGSGYIGCRRLVNSVAMVRVPSPANRDVTSEN